MYAETALAKTSDDSAIPTAIYGSTFKNVPSVIPFNPQAYMEAINNALSGYDNTTSELIRHGDVKGNQYDFDGLMQEAQDIAETFYKANAMEELTAVTDSILGVGNKVTTLSEQRVEELAVVVEAMKSKSQELGLTA